MILMISDFNYQTFGYYA